MLFMGLLYLAQPHAGAQSEVKACQQKTCTAFCQKLNVQQKEIGQCVTQCTQSCAKPSEPAPITITPRYLITGLVYAPPGCTTGSPSGCGTNNGSSFVDYNTTSANGSKVTTKDSFQLGVTITYDSSDLVGGIGGGGSYGFSDTSTDTSSVNITKTNAFEIKALGNGDGIDHGQDVFLLLLHPSVKLKKNANQILWGFADAGASFEVYASELQRPSTMRPGVASVFNELGFTDADYQAILSEDPFGGKVNTANPNSIAGQAQANTNGEFTTGGNTGPGLDPHRFWDTGFSFPYEATLTSPTCNSGNCNCMAVTNSFTNDKVSDNSTEDDGQTTVDLNASVGVPAVWSLKLDTKMVWTTSATTDNTTESKQTAAATITCPSTRYTGLQGMYVWWDSRYGSFVFIPFDPGSVPLLHQGKVQDRTGNPVAGETVKMTYAGKTYHTLTAPDGTYRFPSPTGKPVRTGTAQIETGSLQQTVNIGETQPVVLKMK
jgi:hypothetical protein